MTKTYNKQPESRRNNSNRDTAVTATKQHTQHSLGECQSKVQLAFRRLGSKVQCSRVFCCQLVIAPPPPWIPLEGPLPRLTFTIVVCCVLSTVKRATSLFCFTRSLVGSPHFFFYLRGSSALFTFGRVHALKSALAGAS